MTECDVKNVIVEIGILNIPEDKVFDYFKGIRDRFKDKWIDGVTVIFTPKRDNDVIYLNHLHSNKMTIEEMNASIVDAKKNLEDFIVKFGKGKEL